MTDPERVSRLLGGEDLAWFVQRVRQRLERGRPLTGRLTLGGASGAQRAAMARLLGAPVRAGASLSVDLEAVGEVLRRSGACPDGLGAAVVLLEGQVRVLSTEAARLAAEWDAAFASLGAEGRPVLDPWREHLRASGLVKRLAGTPEAATGLLADAARVVAELPVVAEPRGTLAARVIGHAHALDEGQALTTLVFRAAQALGGVGDGDGAQWRRDVWESVGVLRDDLSSTVLALGVPGAEGTALGRVLRTWRGVGQPVSLTLRQVRTSALVEALGIAAGQDVFVCENPVVLSAAADRWGGSCAPLVCTNGQPGVAVQVVLRGLVDAGARLHHHGDFDWGGLRITNGLIARFAVTPWRMDVESYRAASATGLGRPLVGTPTLATWDAALAPAMSSLGLGLDEEHVLDALLADLADQPGSRE